jgi:asparagine synthase (glutamine-hydrolysing)
MCGIYGLVGAGATDGVGARMGETLVHRGPDAGGHAALAGALLGCRRLAIVDVAHGAQPVWNEAGDVVAVCNGEIYNHDALRADLARRGHVFRSRSDAEVLPHLYEEHGPDFVSALGGMFAVAVWDARRRQLVLARDRMGEKPLYWAEVPGGVAFASEPKALLATGRVAPTPDWSALADYLRLGYVPNPATAFATVRKLPPAGRLVVDAGGLRTDTYWSVVRLLDAPVVDATFADAAAMLRAELARAVDGMLLGDGPVGAFLSGGLDSTAVAALAARRGRLQTFAIAFEDAGFDERAHAAAAARALGTDHRTLVVTPAAFLEGARTLLPLMDEPLADPAAVPTFLLARMARAHVKTVLVGEGADELFAGYPTYVGAALAARWARLPPAVRRAVQALAPSLGASHGNTTVRFLLRRFLEVADRSPAARHLAWVGCMDDERLARLVQPSGPLAPGALRALPPARTELDAVLGADLTGYLADGLLVKVDRATMAASLEGRAPFLDRRVVELACRLPIAWKLRGVATKRILRRAVADVVPAATRRRVKRGLTVPLAAWLAGPLLPLVRDTLARLDPRVFRIEAVDELLDDHVARRRDNRRELWALVAFQLWADANASACTTRALAAEA